MSIVLPQNEKFLTDAFGSRLRDGARVGPDLAKESSVAGMSPVGNELRQVLLTLGTAVWVGGPTVTLHTHARVRP